MVRRLIVAGLMIFLSLTGMAGDDAKSAADISLTEYFVGVYYSSSGECGKAIPHFEKAKALFRDAAIYLELSDCYAYQGTMEKAISVLEEGIRAFPQDGRLFASMGDMYYGLYRAGMPSDDIVQEAYDNLLKGWELSSDREAGSKAVEMAAILNKPEEAAKLYESFPLEMRRQPQLLAVMLDVYDAAGLKNRLRKTIKMLSNAHLKSPDFLNHVINQAISHSFYKEALKLMQQQIQAAPGSFEKWDKFMFVALAASDCKTVNKVFNERYKKNPTPLSLYSMASCLGRRHRYKKAAVFFSRSLSSDLSGWGEGVHLEVMRDYLKVLVASGNYKKALTVAKDGLQAFPDSMDLKSDLVYIDVLNNRTKQAIQTATALSRGQDGFENLLLVRLKKNPSFLKYYFKGMVFYALEDYERAFSQLKKAHRMEPDNRDVGVPLAFIYDRKGKQNEVISLYRKLLKVYPKDALLLNNYSYSLLSYHRHLKEGLMLAKTAVDLVPESPTYRDTLGYAYLLLEKLDAAEDNLRFAYEKNPENGEICQHLGEVYFRKGNFRKARELWLEAIENGGVDEASLKKKISFLDQ
ncbi:MAG: tetratricopeptide repeat protein [Acidobacteria bacterium]|nr:tetratricopeptide repeat protein [Acidobacteriota bacterium]